MADLKISSYPFKSWPEFFPTREVDLKDLPFHSSWAPFFHEEFAQPYFKEIEEYLSLRMCKTRGKVHFFPFPSLLYEAFCLTPLPQVKVVILGQDPYFNCLEKAGKIIPEAMGLSFSVPRGKKIPSSLSNIYSNLQKHKHLVTYPTHGNLSFWAQQGVLMFNSMLTVERGKAGSHKEIWQSFTDKRIKFLSDTQEDLVFLLWGGFALSKLCHIDQGKHRVLISSHPSGLSSAKPLGKYPAFADFDCFGETNTYLAGKKKLPIVWDIL